MKLLCNGILKLICGFLLMGLCLFLPAGTIHYPGGWLFLVLLFVPMVLLGGYLFFRAPDLLQKRLNGRERERTQSFVVAASGLLFLVSFLLAGFCIIAGSTFQALGNGVLSMIVSIARQLVVLLPAAYLLSLTGKLNLIWLAFPIAELMSVILSGFFLYRMYQKVIKPL